MDFLKLLSHFEGFDADVYDRFDTRRKAMSQFANIGKKLTLATFPLAASAMINKAYGQTATNVLDALQLALKAEYLESHFYVTGVNAASSLGATAEVADGLKRIAYDELLHVSAVRSTITALGGTPLVPYVGPAASKPAGTDYGIDITGGAGTSAGPFAAALTNLGVFLAAAQVFEDNGVRAYKGQAGNIFSNKSVLGAGLGIHSVEARHASWLRHTRAKLANDVTMPKPWISGSDPGNIPSTPIDYNTAVMPIYGAGSPATGAPSASYPAEGNTTQAGIDIASLGVTSAQASEAFDEPIDGTTVVNFLTGKFLY